MSVYVLLPYFPVFHPDETTCLPILGHLRSFALYMKMERFLKLKKKFKNSKGKQYQRQWQKHKQEVSFSCNSNSSQNLTAIAF